MKLPNKVYVYVVQERGEEFLMVGETLKECALVDEVRIVGVYTLENRVQVSLEIKEHAITYHN